MKTAISILSGGLDSAVATAVARESLNVSMAITFDYGQRAAVREIEAARKLAQIWGMEHMVIELPFLKKASHNAITSEALKIPALDMADISSSSEKTNESARAVWVPNRNGIFINVAASLAEEKGIDYIITGFNSEEAQTFPDNSSEFINAANRALSYSTLSGVQVVSPTQELDKTAVLASALELGIDIINLWPCYTNGDKWCGRCESCLRMRRAMQNNNVFDRYEECFRY